MSRFTAAQYDLTGETKNGRPVVCLTTPLAYEVGFLGSGWTLEARAGFCTDLASVPPIPRPVARMLAKTRITRRWLRRLIRGRRWAIRRIGRSAIVHDLMRDDRRWEKLLGDYVFYEAMGVDGVPHILRVAAFLAVLVNFNRD